MHDLILFLVGIVVGGMNAIAGGGMLVGFPVMLVNVNYNMYWKN